MTAAMLLTVALSQPMGSSQEIKDLMLDGEWKSALAVAERVKGQQDSIPHLLMQLYILTDQSPKALEVVGEVKATSQVIHYYEVITYLHAGDDRSAAARLEEVELPEFADKALATCWQKPKVAEQVIRVCLAGELRKSGRYRESIAHLHFKSDAADLEGLRLFNLGMNQRALKQYSLAVQSLKLALPHLPKLEASIAKDVIRTSDGKRDGS